MLTVLNYIDILHRDLIQENEHVDTKLDNEYKLKGEGARNNSRSEYVRKRADSMYCVY